MILPIADILSAADLGELNRRLDAARWVDGAATAGWHARLVKRNRQVDAADAAPLRDQIEQALRRHPVFSMAARPSRFGPLLFSEYGPGMEYGSHVDDALMAGVRSDLAFTLFLSDPAAYQGGQLVVEEPAGDAEFRLPAGSLLLYPATTLHRVAPVTAGTRRAAVGWIRSLVRDAGQRELLFDLETARQLLFEKEGKSREFDLLSKSLSNLLRRWAED